MSPEFRVAVQEIADDGVRVIIHAAGHSSETLDRWIVGDNTLTLDAMAEIRLFKSGEPPKSYGRG